MVWLKLSRGRASSKKQHMGKYEVPENTLASQGTRKTLFDHSVAMPGLAQKSNRFTFTSADVLKVLANSSVKHPSYFQQYLPTDEDERADVIKHIFHGDYPRLQDEDPFRATTALDFDPNDTSPSSSQSSSSSSGSNRDTVLCTASFLIGVWYNIATKYGLDRDTFDARVQEIMDAVNSVPPERARAFDAEERTPGVSVHAREQLRRMARAWDCMGHDILGDGGRQFVTVDLSAPCALEEDMLRHMGLLDLDRRTPISLLRAEIEMEAARRSRGPAVFRDLGGGREVLR